MVTDELPNQKHVGCFYHTVVTGLHADKLKRQLLESHCGVDTDYLKQLYDIDQHMQYTLTISVKVTCYKPDCRL